MRPPLLQRLLSTGVLPQDDGAEVRRMRTTNLASLLGLVTIGAFCAGYLALGLHDLALVAGACAGLSLLGLLLQSVGHRRAAVVALLGGANLVVCYAALRLGNGLGFQYFFVPFCAAALLVGPTSGLRAAFALVPAVLLAAVEVLSPEGAKLAIPTWVLDGLRVASGLLSLGIVGLLVRRFQADTLLAERRAADEHARSERLLLNILPGPIAERLKDTEGSSIADGFAEATVLFADLVGFTELSQELSPERLVRMLNRVFSEFDGLSDELGLEKIKTIGDCYMVAGGLTDARADHAEQMARMALRMMASLDAVNRAEGLSLRLRIGINTGPVVAGVIGKRKFIYDLWGDAVNTASRMESSGVPGRVQLSQSTRERLGEGFEVEDRGSIAVKGKGQMHTWFLKGAT